MSDQNKASNPESLTAAEVMENIGGQMSEDPDFIQRMGHVPQKVLLSNDEWQVLKAHWDAGSRVETTTECVYTNPDDGEMWLSGCGHEFNRAGDRDLYDFCPYCGRPVIEDASPSVCSDGPAEAGELAPVHPSLASRSEAAGDPVADVGPPAVKTSGEPT